jgi:hypothetical protein
MPQHVPKVEAGFGAAIACAPEVRAREASSLTRQAGVTTCCQCFVFEAEAVIELCAPAIDPGHVLVTMLTIQDIDGGFETEVENLQVLIP